jgi:hypothetical protein
MMMSETKHTETPWIAEDRTDNGGGFSILAPHAHYSRANVAHYISGDDAALIVTAVNAFEPMKVAAKQIVENLELLEGEMSAYRTNPADEDELIITVGDARALRAVLRLAEGEKE